MPMFTGGKPDSKTHKSALKYAIKVYKYCIALFFYTF